MKIRPFEDAGGFTTFHNSILDHIMPLCNPNEWKIVCVTLRKTIGWRKSEDWISLSQYQRLTGMKSRPTVHKAVHGCLSKGFVTRTPHKDSFKYSLNKEYSLEIEPASGSKIKPVGGLESEHTKDTITIDTNTTEKNKNGAKPTPSKKRDERLDHPAIKAHKEIMRLHVPIIFREAVVNIVGDSPKSLNRWKQTLRDWIGAGYNPRGIQNILDKFKGGSPKKKEKKPTDYISGEFAEHIEH